MQITLILTNTKAKIVGLLNRDVIKKIDLELSYEINGYQFKIYNTNFHRFSKGSLRSGYMV